VIAELGVSQASFAQSIGRSRETVNAWVTGRRTNDHESARRIAAIARAGLGLDVEGEHFHAASSAPLDDIRVQVEQLAKQLAAEPRRGPTMFLALLEINRPTREERLLIASAARELEVMAETNRCLAAAIRARVIRQSAERPRICST